MQHITRLLGQYWREVSLLTLVHGNTVEIVDHMVLQVCAEAGLDSFKTWSGIFLTIR